MNEILLRLVCLAIGYGFGLFQTAYIVGRIRGIDIRRYGSGNSGTTNALRVLGTGDGLIVFAGDLLKGLLAILVTWLLFRNRYPELVWVLKMYTFAGTVLGHDFPFYMGFKGGKGVAVVAGFCFAYHIAFLPVHGARLLPAQGQYRSPCDRDGAEDVFIRKTPQGKRRKRGKVKWQKSA